MNIGPHAGPGRCEECGNAGPGLREMEFRAPAAPPGRDKPRLVVCPGCAFKIIHVLKTEFSRPHLRTGPDALKTMREKSIATSHALGLRSAFEEEGP